MRRQFARSSQGATVCCGYASLLICGDQGGQFVVGASWQGSGFAAFGNQNITNGKFVGCRLVSLSAEATSFGLTIQGSGTPYVWQTVSSPSISIGNVLTLPTAGLPAGLTATALQYSAPLWQPDAPYTTGQYVANPYNGIIGSTAKYLCTAGGLSSSTGTGPTGNGGSITDGGVTWAYVAGSNGNASSVFGSAEQFISGAARYDILPGSCVIAYSASGGTSTITFQPPTGAANAIASAITSQVSVFFTAGAPPGALTASILNCSFDSCELSSFQGCCGHMQNSDSSGEINGGWSNCVADTSLTNAASVKNNTATFYVDAGAFGGVTLRIKGCTTRRPYFNAVYTRGNLNDWDISGNTFDSAQVGAAATKATVYLAGTNTSTLPSASGVLDNNKIWAPQGGSLEAVHFGAINGANSGGEMLQNAMWNVTASRNRAYGINNGNFMFTVSYGGNVKLSDNTPFPSVVGGADSARFLQINSNATGFVNSNGNNLANLNGAPYSNAGSGPFYTGGDEIYSSNLGTGSYRAVPTMLPTPTFRAGVLAIVA